MEFIGGELTQATPDAYGVYLKTNPPAAMEAGDLMLAHVFSFNLWTLGEGSRVGDSFQDFYDAGWTMLNHDGVLDSDGVGYGNVETAVLAKIATEPTDEKVSTQKVASFSIQAVVDVVAYRGVGLPNVVSDHFDEVSWLTGNPDNPGAGGIKLASFALPQSSFVLASFDCDHKPTSGFAVSAGFTVDRQTGLTVRPGETRQWICWARTYNIVQGSVRPAVKGTAYKPEADEGWGIALAFNPPATRRVKWI